MSKDKSTLGVEDNPSVDEVNAEDFDLNDWIDGATAPARTIKVYRNAGLRAEYDALELDFNRLSIVLDKEDAEDGSTLEDVSVEGRLLEIAEQMKQIISELEAGELRVKVRGVTADEQVKIKARVEAKKIRDDAALYERLACAGLKPALDADEWRRFREVIGESQFAAIAEAVAELSGWVGASQVMPDFSRAASAALATRAS